jgi:hypothetical protein
MAFQCFGKIGKRDDKEVRTDDVSKMILRCGRLPHGICTNYLNESEDDTCPSL